jgi:predicted outer membrane repeat protein
MNQREQKAEFPSFMRNKFLTGTALMRIYAKVKIIAISLVLLWTIDGFAYWDTVYVDKSRPEGGDGKSWFSAFNELDTAISYNPDTNLVILCAEGTYYPKAVKGKFLRNSKKDFKIIGGYPKFNTNNSSPNPDTFKVILDGDIDKNDTLLPDSTYIIKGKNASTVLYIDGYGDCWFEGLTFQHGDNNIGNGGGLYIKGKTNILNCHFYGNRAINGGAICAAGWDTLKIDSCIFQNNNSTDTTKRNDEHIGELDGGGAIYANAKLFVAWSKFINNHSENAGGAICIHDDNLFHSTGNKYKSNSAMSFGGAIYSRVQKVISIDDSVLNNTAARGGGGMLSYNSLINIDKIVFQNNKSGQHGGALVLGSNGTLKNCSFLSNTADSCGGALYVNSNSDSGLIFYNVKFKNNKANLHGGAMYVLSGPFCIKDSSSFEGNRAFQNGGAIFLKDTVNIVIQVANTLFKSDSAVYGGAIYSETKQMDSSLITHCKFQLNKAFSSYAVTFQKGGIFRNCLINSNSSGNGCIIAGKSIDSTGPVIRECTIVNNFPADSKVVEYIPLIKNTIIWNGRTGDSCGTVEYSIIQNWNGGGKNNLSRDPKLSISKEYQITGGSPAIDMGDFNLSGVAELDLNGKARIRGSAIDIGAYEHYGKIYVDSRAVGGNNGSSWGHAYNLLHEALRYSGDGDTIWVAKGVYYADYVYPLFYFLVPKNVTLIGGFRGDEISLSQRDWRLNITTLSGEINSHYSPYSIIRPMANSVVDGFRIIKGEVSACYLDSSDNATIRNCIISNDSTNDYGAAITINNSDNVLIENCFISNNIADGPGVAGMGAINCNDLKIRNCIFTGNNNSNTSNVSAALFKNCNLSIVNCTFSRNNSRTLRFDKSSVVMVNNIIWNDSTGSDTLIQLCNSSFYARNCDIRKGISGIKKDSSSIINDDGELFNLNPRFQNVTSDNVNRF